MLGVNASNWRPFALLTDSLETAERLATDLNLIFKHGKARDVSAASNYLIQMFSMVGYGRSCQGVEDLIHNIADNVSRDFIDSMGYCWLDDIPNEYDSLGVRWDDNPFYYDENGAIRSR